MKHLCCSFWYTVFLLPFFISHLSQLYFHISFLQYPTFTLNPEKPTWKITHYPSLNFLCSILFLLYFLTTISSSFSSDFFSSIHLCTHHQALNFSASIQTIFFPFRVLLFGLLEIINMINIPRQSHGKRVQTAACGMGSLVTWKPGKWLNWTLLIFLFLCRKHSLLFFENKEVRENEKIVFLVVLKTEPKTCSYTWHILSKHSS